MGRSDLMIYQVPRAGLSYHPILSYAILVVLSYPILLVLSYPILVVLSYPILAYYPILNARYDMI